MRPTRWITLAGFSVCVLSLSPAVVLAADSDTNPQASTANQQAGTAGQRAGTTATETGGTTTANQNEVAAPPRQLNEELAAITPQFGFLNYMGASGGLTARAVYGFTADFNLSQTVNKYANGSTAPTDFFIGPTVGLFYSHLGDSTGSSFFGDSNAASPGLGDDAGANVAMIPVDLKVGWTFGNFRASVHGGGNVFYRTVTSSISVNPDTNDPNNWSMQPNVGADLELAVPGGVGVLIRPDWTLGGSGRVVATTLGIMIPIS